MWEQGEYWTCVCVWVAVVSRLGQVLEGWYYICMSCEPGLFIYIAGPCICILC